MTIAFPVSGNFIDYADRFVDPAFSFAAGFSMWMGWTAIVAAEATFFATIVNYWAKESVHPAVWCEYMTLFPKSQDQSADDMTDTVFLLLMVVIFALPTAFFGWFECEYT